MNQDGLKQGGCLKKYEVLLMDADGTLLDFDRSEEEAFKRVLAQFGFPPEKRLVQEYHQINRACWEAFEEGQMRREDVLTIRFVRFFAGHGREVSGREVEECYRGYLDQGSYVIPGALELCAYLKERYALYIVTNGVANTQYRRLKDSGLSPYFQDVFISEEAGSQKPQREFFDYCFRKMPGADPAKMLVIGDSLTSDMRGGVNAGLDTCWYNPRGEENRKGIPVTYEIRRLEELKGFL